MRYGLTVPNSGDFSGARLLAEVARDPEAAGWDGFFLWDHVQFMPLAHVDSWVALTAIALATQRIRLGPLVTPLPRRRPVKLARETISLDHISDGAWFSASASDLDRGSGTTWVSELICASGARCSTKRSSYS